MAVSRCHNQGDVGADFECEREGKRHGEGREVRDESIARRQLAIVLDPASLSFGLYTPA